LLERLAASAGRVTCTNLPNLRAFEGVRRCRAPGPTLPRSTPAKVVQTRRARAAASLDRAVRCRIAGPRLRGGDQDQPQGREGAGRSHYGPGADGYGQGVIGMGKRRRGRDEQPMTVAEARAFLASLPKKGDRYLAAMVPGPEALEHTEEVAEATAAAIKRVADAVEILKTAGEPLP
jgi:hypothetical protein